MLANQNSPATDLPILQKLSASYKFWQNIVPHIKRMTRYSLGAKIEVLFTEAIEAVLLAIYASREQKMEYITQASNKVDFLKYFLQLAWDMKIIDNNKYTSLSVPLAEVGKMLGGWKRQNESEPPVQRTGSLI